MRFLASAKDVKGGIAGVVGKEAGLFDDLSASAAEKNEFVNQLRDEVRAWREAGWPGTAVVTRRLLEWWFERDEERRATAKRFFFCQQEAVETVIYLYEVQNRRKMPETGELLRYALKLATGTGTGKTVVMALFVTWATLHKRKVSGSALSANFLVLVPNLTVRDRVSGQPRGDGLDPAGEHNLGGAPEAVMTLEEVRKEWPVLRTAFLMAEELHQETNPGSAGELGIGPTFDELLDVSRRFLDSRVVPLQAGGLKSDLRDVGIYYWRRQALDALDTAIRGAGAAGVEAVPILGNPEWLDSANLRRFQWTGIVAEGKRCHTNKVPCHTDLEKRFADFLDGAKDVVRYFKNERLGFSVTYYESNRPRQYYPDFIIAARDKDGREVIWLAETKGEVRTNTALKSEAARLWCEKMNGTKYGQWRYLFVQQKKLEAALASGVASLAELAQALVRARPEPQFRLISIEDERVKREAFKTLLPLYTLKAAAGYFGNGEAVETEGWIETDGVGRLDHQMFVCRAVGRSMEPTIRDGDFLVMRAKPAGTREGKIVLAQYRGPADPDTGGAFTVKRYSSEKEADEEAGWRHTRVTLSPTNPEYSPIILSGRDAGTVEVVAEFLTVLRGS